MTPTERAPIGDRLERAIEERVDVEQELERARAQEPSRRSLRRTLVLLAITAVSLYLVAPGLIETLSSWRDIDEMSLGWLLAMVPLQAGALACLWTVQRLAVHAAGWHAVATSQLAGNAIAKVAPGGGALGAALQYRMLVQAGVEPSRAVSGLTAANVLLLSVVLALPLLAIPAIAGGSVDRGLVAATVVGAVVFAALFVVAGAMLALDGPLAWVGRTFERLRNRARRGAQPVRGVAERLVAERDELLATLGPSWREALAATVGRWAFDYASLLAALAAVGSTPRPALVLLAFATAQVLTQVPITPGGLGFVEAGLTATLTLAGVPPGKAVLATFAYRLFTYWLPLPLGLLGAALHRRRYPA
ncbi:MAG: lysylphosphatidylglycerol synthase transmembrane domain-containing protein [Thermoleophilaceae bacterium]